jgi:hypothetical protein
MVMAWAPSRHPSWRRVEELMARAVRREVGRLIDGVCGDELRFFGSSSERFASGRGYL